MSLKDDFLQVLQNKNQTNNIQSTSNNYGIAPINTSIKIPSNTGNLYNDFLSQLQQKRQIENEQKEANRREEEARKKAEEERKVEEAKQKEEEVKKKIEEQVKQASKAGVNTNNTLRGNTEKAPIASNLQVANSENGISNKIEKTIDKKYLEAELNPEKYVIKPSQAFKDGYQFGDVSKTVGSTAGDLVTNFVEGVAGVGEGAGKLAAGGVAQIADWIGNDEYANKIREKLVKSPKPIISKIENKIEKPLDKNSILGGKADNLTENIGQMAGYWAGGEVAGTLTGASGLSAETAAKVGKAVSDASMFTSASGNSLSESYSKDNIKDWQAWTKAVGSGGIEVLTERLFGLFGTSGLDTGLANKVSSQISSGIGKVLARNGIQASGEAVEEMLSYIGNQGLDKMIDSLDNVTGGKGAKFHQNWNWEDVGEQMGMAFLSASLIGGGTNISSTINNKTNSNTWIDAINENAKQQDIAGQVTDLNNEIEKIENKKLKETDVSKINELNNELYWKQKQLDTLITKNIDNTQQNSPVAPLNTQQERNVVAPTNVQNLLNNEISTAVQNKTSKGKVSLGRVTENVVNSVKSLLGIDVTNRTHVLADNDIRHMLNEHGDPEIEAKRGQIAITENDIQKIPDIINSYDDIVKGNPNKNGDTIRYIKSFEDGTTYLVEVIPETSKTLNIKTMWKKPTSLANHLEPSLTSETQSRLISSTSNNIISQNEYNMQDDIKKATEARLQLPRVSDFSTNDGSFVNNSIPPTNQNVNSDTITNNYTQNYENNAPFANNIQEETNPTRHDVIQQYRNLAKENIENISTWKDKKRGLSYQLETMERNMYDIIPDKAEAKKINETYFEPIHESEAQKQKFINSYNGKIKNLNLNKYESEAVQLLGEQKYNPDFKANEVQETLDKVNNNIERGKINKQKVEEAIETFRNIYDELFELENQVLRENGYKEKPYRKGYFPHFIDYVPETKTEKILNKLGFKIDKRPLPTDIAGITEQFVPGKTWNKSALERKGNKTDYNALKGFDTYIAQAADNIFHTDNIQRLRGLENEIRYQYSDKGVQNRINKILNDEVLNADEKQEMIDTMFKQVDNPMPNLVTELRRYTNALANKKSEADRSIEQMAGRSIYSTVNAIENRFGANAVGLNIGSAITNFIPITQAWSQVSTKNMGRAVIDTVKSYINNDGFVDKSAFLTSRLNQSEKLYKTPIEKISDKTSFLFNAIDEVTSNIVVRGKYLENIKKGMSESEAIKNADQFARNVMADRSKGALPTKFEEKNPITKAFTQFQLEVNNQYRYMFKDLPRDLAEKGLGAIALAFFKMFVGAWLYNEASEKVTGRRPAFDPIDIVTSAYKNITDEKKETYDKIASIGKDVTEELPFIGGLVGGGRIPVNGAIPDVANLTKAGVGLATGEMDSKKAISNIGKEVSKPLYYLVPPFGGGQLKKTKEGLETVINGGSYGVDSKRKRLASISCRRC